MIRNRLLTRGSHTRLRASRPRRDLTWHDLRIMINEPRPWGSATALMIRKRLLTRAARIRAFAHRAHAATLRDMTFVPW